jgi:hypothetical protein
LRAAPCNPLAFAWSEQNLEIAFLSAALILAGAAGAAVSCAKSFFQHVRSHLSGAASYVPANKRFAGDEEKRHNDCPLDEAWRKIQQSGSQFARPAYSRVTRELIAKRIREMAQQGVKDQHALVDDAVLAANCKDLSE